MLAKLISPRTSSAQLVNPLSRAVFGSFQSKATGNLVNQYSTSVQLKIPPIKRVGETEERKRARLVYQSRKRGILETDLLLSRFAAKHLNSMTPEELDEYDSLLDELDWDIYYWATKNYEITPLPEKFKNSKLLKKLQDFSENREKEILRMPDLQNK
ncbi:LAME_0F05534g1_1 [Lachancea meyersii CBS 8951]|uniref:Succinate dehydrogenase assembly factor 2, mitochondrial n=1 Tax=Lachancea meyersii CBS 8951 TaxID=1266667 RepID=A0A1G4JT93_9SACH|nr:LAME_0F05534g1_1 [Lachancea meyersii CBS 8951]